MSPKKEKLERVSFAPANFDDVPNPLQMVRVRHLNWDGYDDLPEGDRQRAQAVTIEIRERDRLVAENMVEIGRRLIEMKKLLPDRFTEWVETEFRFGTTFTRQMIAAFKRFGEKPELVDVFGSSTAIRLASSKRLSDEQVAAMAALARAEGRVVKVVEVQDALREAGQPIVYEAEGPMTFRVEIDRGEGDDVVEGEVAGPGQDGGEGGSRRLTGATRNAITVRLDVGLAQGLLTAVRQGALHSHLSRDEEQALIQKLAWELDN